MIHSSPMTTNWQPIESAPKDGTSILIWDDWRKGIGVAVWIGGEWRWSGPAECDEYPGNGPVDATHWEALPDPPTQIQQYKAVVHGDTGLLDILPR